MRCSSPTRSPFRSTHRCSSTGQRQDSRHPGGGDLPPDRVRGRGVHRQVNRLRALRVRRRRQREGGRGLGINVFRVRIIVMSISAFTAAITGLLQTAQLSSGNSNIAQGLEFDAIAAAVIGGTSMAGGKGSVAGTLIGVLFVAILLNGMVLLGMNPYLQQVVRGTLVLIAVMINVIRARRAEASA
ncbi:ABC transporter permease [Tessaracoccus sp. HDW20]|uniref:ABC transporter permease n=1 Tax=Tessaracoccus coleopterorum TaxID=2714950 RepID=UPI0018D2FA15|nr:ABC transporter permease [Tessaracoccus coleopterorum]NHB84540.1 ABC transporter permease [Tessaracoccus coleopterorum]